MYYRITNNYVVYFETDGLKWFCTVYDKTGKDWRFVCTGVGETERASLRDARNNYED